MWDENVFKNNAAAVSEKYSNLENQFSWLAPHNIENAYTLYQNAYCSHLNFLVCGRTRINSVRSRIHGSSIEEIELVNLGATNHRKAVNDCRVSFSGNGSILHYNEKWHFLLNDSWLLGGIHANLQFHLASPRHKENIVDMSNQFLTVTGRELTGLKEFGYQFVKTNHANIEIAICVDPKKAKNADFSQYWNAIERQEGGKKLDFSLIDPAAKLVNPETKNIRIWDRSVSKFSRR